MLAGRQRRQRGAAQLLERLVAAQRVTAVVADHVRNKARPQQCPVTAGGFDDGLGQGVYRGDYHAEGEVWDVSHPTAIVDAAGRRFEFDHDWAENFTRLTSEGETGLAHFECVVIREAQSWSS